MTSDSQDPQLWYSGLKDFQKQELKETQNTITNYIRECKKDRKKSTSVKRWGRFLNIFLGLAITGLGFTIAFPGFETWNPSFRFGIGLVNALCGVGVSFVNEYLNPNFSRKRAVAIHTLISEFQYLNYTIEEQKASSTLNKIEEKQNEEIKKFMIIINETLKDLTNEAHKLGVYV